LENPVPADLVATEMRRLARDGVSIVHTVIGRRGQGDQVPVVRLTPAHPNGRLTVVSSIHGKGGLLTPEGRFTPIVTALLGAGQSVVGYSPLLLDEAADSLAFQEGLPDSLMIHTYNHVLAAQQMQDLATVLAWARSQPDVSEANLLGLGTMGPAVLVARPALEGVARTVVDLHDIDLGDGSGNLSAAIDLPGLFQFGGLKAAAALTAPAPLWIFRSGSTFARTWPERSYELAGVPQQLRIDSRRVPPEELVRWLDSGQ